MRQIVYRNEEWAVLDNGALVELGGSTIVPPGVVITECDLENAVTGGMLECGIVSALEKSQVTSYLDAWGYAAVEILGMCSDLSGESVTEWFFAFGLGFPRWTPAPIGADGRPKNLDAWSGIELGHGDG